MKKHTLFLLLLAFGTVRGQIFTGSATVDPRAGGSNITVKLVDLLNDTDIIRIKPGTTIIEYADTIEIKMPLHIHFIKIGPEVYQIVEHPATIEKFGGVYIQNNTVKYDELYRQLIKSIIDSKP